MKKSASLLIGVLLIALIGCGAQTQPAPESNLLDYNLGEGTLTDSNGREIAYEMQGLLGIPVKKAARWVQSGTL